MDINPILKLSLSPVRDMPEMPSLANHRVQIQIDTNEILNAPQALELSEHFDRDDKDRRNQQPVGELRSNGARSGELTERHN